MQVRTTYLTIRCPHGCEAWLHARASVEDHLDRCTGRPWIDDITDVAVVPAEYTSLIAEAVDVDLLGTVSLPGDTRAEPGDGRAKRAVPTPAGLMTVATPIAGIRPRRWLTVAIAAIERLGNDGLDRALDPTAFHDVEAQVLAKGAYVECATCGALISTRGLKRHQANNAACAWRRAATEVRNLWAAGWRDPYSVHDAPLAWSELRAKARWRNALRTVLLPRWIAVLLPTMPDGGTCTRPRGPIPNGASPQPDEAVLVAGSRW